MTKSFETSIYKKLETRFKEASEASTMGQENLLKLDNDRTANENAFPHQ